MTKKELSTLFTLAEKLYIEEQERSGLISPIPYAYAEGEGKFLAISVHSGLSKKMKEELRKWGIQESL